MNITGKEGILQVNFLQYFCSCFLFHFFIKSFLQKKLLSLAMSHHTKMLLQLQFHHTVSMFINSTHLGLRFSQSILQAMVWASVIFRFRFNG